MRREKQINRKGFTLTELMLTITIATIVIIGIGVVLADNLRGWNRMYNRVYSDVVTDGYVAKKAFDAVVRKATSKRCELDTNGQFVEVYYYQDFSSTEPDRYAIFYINGQELLVNYGPLEAGTGNTLSPSSTVKLARNVRSVNFSVTGACVKMVLELDNSSEAITVTSSAIRHN